MIKRHSTGTIEEVMYEDDGITVTRITIPPGSIHRPDQAQSRRLIIAVSGSEHIRHLEAQPETIKRTPGDVVHRKGPATIIHNKSSEPHVSVVVKFKR